jgi:hypothetical protein
LLPVTRMRLIADACDRLPAPSAIRALFFFAATLCGCSHDEAPIGPCEPQAQGFQFRTADGQPTIASVDSPWGCLVTDCASPGDAAMACSAVQVIADGSCVLVFHSTGGQRQEVSITATPVGPPQKCRDVDRVYDFTPVSFTASQTTIFFAPPDASTGD